MKTLLEERFPEAVKALQHSISIRSVRKDPAPGAPYGPEVLQALDNVLDLGERLGLRVGNFKNEVGWIEFGEAPEMVAFLGHVDVVPEGEGWRFPPFGGEIHEGVMFGRGVLDDKGPVIAAIFALSAIKDAKLPIGKRIRILVGTNEENGFSDVKRYVSEGEELPVMGFTSDACYPVLNREKGALHLLCEAPFHAGGGAVIVEMSGGSATNVVPSSARAVLAMSPPEMGTFVVEIAEKAELLEQGGLKWEKVNEDHILVETRGVAEHGSKPAQGFNAIMLLMSVLETAGLSHSQKSLVSVLNRMVGFETDGKSLGIRMNDTESGDLTVNLGTFAQNEGKAAFSLDIRYPVTKTAKEILSRLAPFFSKWEIKERVLFDAPPLFVSPSAPLVKKLQKVYTEETGEEADLLSTGESTYAKTMPNLVNFGPIFPWEKYAIHQADECWSLKSFRKNMNVIAAALYELAR